MLKIFCLSWNIVCTAIIDGNGKMVLYSYKYSLRSGAVCTMHEAPIALPIANGTIRPFNVGLSVR